MAVAVATKKAVATRVVVTRVVAAKKAITMAVAVARAKATTMATVVAATRENANPLSHPLNISHKTHSPLEVIIPAASVFIV